MTPVCSDKTASKQILAKLVTDAKLGSVGLGDKFQVHAKRPLAEATMRRIAKGIDPAGMPKLAADVARVLGKGMAQPGRP